MHLVIPVDEVGAGLAPGAIAPLVFCPVRVPLLNALVVSLKRRIADAYLSSSAGDKCFETVERAIHAALRVKRRRRMTPGSTTVHPKSCTRAPIKYCSVADTSICGHPGTAAVEGLSVDDTDTQARCGDFVGSMRNKKHKQHHPWLSRGGFFLDMAELPLSPGSRYQ